MLVASIFLLVARKSAISCTIICLLTLSLWASSVPDRGISLNLRIPIISKEEGGEIVQHAEIERNEIIFTLEVTNKLEKLAKNGSDEDAIEAGKLLVKEILYNTDDRTGLINEIE